jgi:hypothetical protein
MFVQEIMQTIELWIELVLEGAREPIGRWKWAPAVPRAGEIVQHEGGDLLVVAVTWSTTDPRMARLTVRAT